MEGNRMSEQYHGHSHLEGAIDYAVLEDGDTPEGSIVIGWAVAVAYRTPDQMLKGDNSVTHAWFTMAGQPPYATVGLLEFTADDLRETEEPS
jgi:hypothetical protein